MMIRMTNGSMNYLTMLTMCASMRLVSPTKQASRQLHDKLSTMCHNNVKDTESWSQKDTDKQVNPIMGSKSFNKVVSDNLFDADYYLNLARRNMCTNAYKSFKGIIGQARSTIDSSMFPSKAISQTTTQWAEQGIPALIDKAGRNWSPDVYVKTVVNSSINRSLNDTELIQYK